MGIGVLGICGRKVIGRSISVPAENASIHLHCNHSDQNLYTFSYLIVGEVRCIIL